MRSMRGLYVIRGGVGMPTLSPDRRAADGASATSGTVDEGLGRLVVDFSRFDSWYEINSFWEGRFLERTRRGAFKRTLDQRGSQIKVLFNHGMDLNIGDKVLGVPDVLEERPDSPHLEAPLLDTSYNRDLAPGLRAGAYGSSFMFEVLAEEWVNEPEASDYNPEGLPERTITEVRLFEAGPVTWPANPDSTASLRSGMDWYATSVAERDHDRYAVMARQFEAFRALNGIRTSPVGEPATVEAPTPTASAPGKTPARHVKGASAAARARRLALNVVGRGSSHGSNHGADR